MRRLVSWKRVLIVAGVFLCLSAATYGVHAVQVRRQVSVLKERAIKGEEAAAGNPEKVNEVIGLYQQYLKFRKTDEDAFQRYAALMYARAKADPKQTAATADAMERFLRQFPDHPEDRIRLIDLYMRLGQLTSAKQHIQILFDSSKGNYKEDPDLLDKAATCELALGGDFATAVRYLDTAIQTKRAPARTIERILGLLRSNPSFNDVRFPMNKYVEILLESEPYKSSVEARVVAGRFLLLRGDKNARTQITHALERMPGGATNADALIAAAELELTEVKEPATIVPQLKKAQAHLEKAFAAHPQDVRVALMLSGVLTDLGEVRKAIDVLRTASQALGETNDEFLRLVDRLIDLKEQDLSNQLIAKVAANDIDGTRIVKYFRGRMALLKGDWGQARTLLEEVAPVLARTPEFHKKAMAGIGRCYEVLQNPDRQLEYYSAALKDDPHYLVALVGKAEALLQLGRFRDALPDYQLLVHGYKLDAYRPKLARLELRVALRQPADHRSWDAFNKSLGPVESLTPELQILLAESLVARGQDDKAAESLERLVQKDPKNWAAWLTLTRVRSGGKPEQVLAKLNEVQKQTGEDLVEFRLARSAVLVSRAKKPTPADLRALAAGSEKFSAAEQGRLWRGIGEAAVRATGVVSDSDAPAMRALAIECFQKAADLDHNDLISRAILVDLGLAAGRKDVIDAALAGIAAVEGDKGPMGSLAQVVVGMPAARRIDDKAARAAAIKELRELALRAKAERPGWGRVYVALGQLDEMEGLTDSALGNYTDAIDKGEREIFVIRRAVDLYRDRKQDKRAALLLNSLHTEVQLPEDLERFRVIRDLLSQDIPRSQRPTIDRIAPEGSKDWRILLLRGALLAAIGADADAEKAYRGAVALGDNVADTWGSLVAHLIRLGRADDAKRAVAQAEEKLKSNPPKTDSARAELILTLAGCQEMIGDTQAAEARYREAARVAPHDLNPTRQLVLFLQRSGKMPEADQLLQRLVDDPAQDLARWARRHLALTIVSRADAYNQRAVALRLIDRNLLDGQKPDPEDVKAKAVVQTIDPTTREEGTKTLEEFAKWDDLTPDEFHLLGRLYFDQGKVSNSIEFFEKAARPRAGLNPEHLATPVRVFLGMNNLQRARNALARLKAYAPQSWEMAREEARLLHKEAIEAERENNKEGAKKLNDQARERVLGFPGSQTEPFIRSRSGPILEELGFAAEAEALYRRVLNESRADGAHLPLAVFLINQKRTAEAIELARKHEGRTSVVVTARILSGAIRAKSPGTSAEREVAAWLDEKLRETLGKPAYPAILGAKAELLDAIGRYDEAIAVYEEAARVGKSDLVVNNLCMLLALYRPEMADRAIEMVSEQIAIRGPVPTLLDTRAVAYLIKGGKTKEAIADLDLALIQRINAVYLFHLAWAYDLSPDERNRRLLPLKQAKDLGLTPADLHPLEARKFEELYRPK